MRNGDAGRGPACGKHASPSETGEEPALVGTCWLFSPKSGIFSLQAATLEAK